MLNRLNQPKRKNMRPAQAMQLPAQIANLSYAPKDKLLLADISFTLGADSKTIIMGPNGAGKSLLLRALHGLIEPTRGQISWAGEPANIKTRKQQAMVFQKPILLRRSVASNIAFVLKHLPKNQREPQIDQLLHMARLSIHAKTPARLLSGGEQQRLAIVRALAIKPLVLFLDEPTASLDPSSTQAVEELIEKAHNAGTKVVLVTHDIGQAKRLADEIVFLNHGQLTEYGPAREFFERPKSDAARAYLSGQLYLE